MTTSKDMGDMYVRREEILKYFDPSPGRSTFFDWVNRGLVRPGNVKGYYKLNATLRNFNLPLVDVVAYQKEMTDSEPVWDRQRALLFTAMCVLVEEALLCPADRLLSVLTTDDIEVVSQHVSEHQDGIVKISAANSSEAEAGLARLSYVGGVLDAYDASKDGSIRGYST